MRLLQLDDNGQISLTKDLRDDVPPYGILSHTWGADQEEVTFNDLSEGLDKSNAGSIHVKSKAGYKKIQFCGQRARKDGLRYFWVDTCCINKSDMSEFQEAINSMFRWYQGSAKCYVYLADVSSHKRDSNGETERPLDISLRRSRWFTRGWTLQELLAPRFLEFFSRDGDSLGSRESLGLLIQQITEIPMKALQGTQLSAFAVEERLRWVRSRNTTKPEDRVYCLLGIFEASMSLLYGEGEKRALDRLKDEINKQQRIHLDGIRLFPTTPGCVALDQPTVKSIADTQQQDSVERRALLMNSLGFEQMDSRRANIKPAHIKTCAWFLQHSDYLDWNDPDKIGEHHGFLWVKGKPGAGKSTLMKFAHASARKVRSSHELLLSFFFNARGEHLERSVLGMYRSLLLQLLYKAPDLQDVFDEVELPSSLPANPSAWTVEILRELFTAAVGEMSSKQRLRCFIDALDECDERDVQNMILYFENLGEISGDRLHICFASRHYPTVVIRKGLELILEREPGHDDDLIHYVKAHLNIKDKTLLEELELRIPERAEGVFMWAVLVVRILNEEVRCGRIYNVSKRLDEIPAELGDLFKDILRRDCNNMDELLLCLRWILFAERPLKSREFYHAMMVGLVPSPEPIDEGRLKAVTDDDVMNFVHDCSKGLAELTVPKKRKKADQHEQPSTTVQFIHESVRDFLLKDGGLYELWPGLETNVVDLGHEALKCCCMRYLGIDVDPYFPPIDRLPGVTSTDAAAMRRDVQGRFPFLEYASHHVFHHANEAARSISPADFLAGASLQSWIHKFNPVCKRSRRSVDASLLYLLAETNSARLIEILPGIDLELPEIGGRCRYPFLLAVANEAWDTIRAMLEKYNPPHLDEVLSSIRGVKTDRRSLRSGSSPMVWAINNKIERLAVILAKQWVQNAALRKDSIHTDERVFETIAFQGYQSVLDLMLSFGVLDPWHSTKKSMFARATEGGHVSMVQSLLDLDWDPSAYGEQDGVNSMTPLQRAARNGHLQIARLLIKHGMDVSIRDRDGGDALSTAAEYGHTDVVELLLDEGAVLDRSDGNGATALACAACNGHKGTVALLLSKGAMADASVGLRCDCITYLHGHFRAPLSYAAGMGHLEVVQLLLDCGAGLDFPDAHGATALSWAAVQGHRKIVDLLLSRHALADAYVDVEGNCKLLSDGPYQAPLSYAAGQGHVEIARTLLEHGALLRGVGLYTAMALAILFRQREMFEFLLYETIGWDETDPSGDAALVSDLENVDIIARSWAEGARNRLTHLPDVLFWAARNGLEALVKAILEKGIDLDEVRDDRGRTPLMVAARSASVKVIRVLLSYGARCDERNSTDGCTALWHACVSGDIETVRTLLEAGANTSSTSHSGMTAPHTAASLPTTLRDSSAAMIRLLLDHGADIDAVDVSGFTALDIARQTFNDVAVGTLLRLGASQHPSVYQPVV